MSDTPLSIRPYQRIVRAEELAQWQQRDWLIEQAHAEARAIREDAQREAEQLREQSHRETEAQQSAGFEAGRREGNVQAAEQLRDTSARLQRYLGGVEASLVSLSLGVVQRILGEFGDTDLLTRCVQHALGELREETALVVRVAPAQAADLRQALARGSVTHDLHVEADDGLAATQCLLISANTVVDIGPEAQLAIIGRALSAPEDASNASEDTPA